jgi:hypothetical protein
MLCVDMHVRDCVFVIVCVCSCVCSCVRGCLLCVYVVWVACCVFALMTGDVFSDGWFWVVWESGVWGQVIYITP